MKFTLIKDIKKDKTMSLILKGFLVFIFLYLISDILVMNSNFGLSVESISSTLFGNEEEYLDPINEAAFLEFWHIQIFFIMMILFTLSAIFIRLANRSRLIVTNILMISAISSLLAIVLAYYMASFFVSVYIFTFFIWHITAIYMIFYSFWKLNAQSI